MIALNLESIIIWVGFEGCFALGSIISCQWLFYPSETQFGSLVDKTVAYLYCFVISLPFIWTKQFGVEETIWSTLTHLQGFSRALMVFLLSPDLYHHWILIDFPCNQAEQTGTGHFPNRFVMVPYTSICCNRLNYIYPTLWWCFKRSAAWFFVWRYSLSWIMSTCLCSWILGPFK